MEKFYGEYVRGYTKAIVDIIDVFDYIGEDLRFHKKKLTLKNVQEILKVFLENRTDMRENNENHFIRWNCVDNKFECVMMENGDK